MVQVIKVKCLDCNKDFEVFLLKDKGYSLSKYPCPNCRSIRKGMYKNQLHKLDKIPEEFSSMDKVIQGKIIHTAKPSEK